MFTKTLSDNYCSLLSLAKIEVSKIYSGQISTQCKDKQTAMLDMIFTFNYISKAVERQSSINSIIRTNIPVRNTTTGSNSTLLTTMCITHQPDMNQLLSASQQQHLCLAHSGNDSGAWQLDVMWRCTCE